jgi:hypothetical protein
MSLRAVVVGLIVLATIGFVVGTTIERNSEKSHVESPAATHSETSSKSHTESAAEPGAAGETTHAEFRPFGINIEAVPFIVLAALASLGLAAAVWTRPRSLLVLGVVAVAMVLFAALDVREVFHQIDDNRTGLAVLAGVIATLHLAAAAVTGLLARREPPLTGPAGAIPA